jgi:L-seryl-tRNA(Ser) seleniumtransferase
MPTNLLRNLPSVTELLDHPQLKAVRERVSHSVAVSKVRSYLDDLRAQVQTTATEVVLPTVSELAQRIAQRILQGEAPELRPVINATGILLHPGLGRAPLAQSAIEEMVAGARDYANLQLDLETGEPALRGRAAEKLLIELTGAEAALVVNSGAAATLLALAALAHGREVIVGRGQLGETADGFRLLELIAASGAKLREVGAANATRREDYREAVSPGMGMILLVQPEDYRVLGSGEQISLADIVALARQFRINVVQILEAGRLIDLAELGSDEPLISQSVRAGADLVISSGDRLIGGPQCGIIVGKRTHVEVLAGHPLRWALQADKLVLAALAATLRLYRQPQTARDEVPLLQLSTTSVENLKNRAQRLAPQLAACPCVAAAEPIEAVAYLAASAASPRRLPTWCVALTPAEGWSDQRLAEALRKGHPAIVGRLEQGRLLLDLRTVFPRQDQQLAEALAALAKERN